MKILCVSGKAESGKDYFANKLSEQLKMDGNRVLIIHYADLLKYMCKSLFKWNGVKNDEGRELLQVVGTDKVRKYNPNFWFNYVKDCLIMFYGDWDFVLIPDCRFPNEICGLVDFGFNVESIRINRVGSENSLLVAQCQHVSETSLDDYKFQHVFENDMSEKFNETIVQFAKQIQNCRTINLYVQNNSSDTFKVGMLCDCEIVLFLEVLLGHNGDFHMNLLSANDTENIFIITDMFGIEICKIFTDSNLVITSIVPSKGNIGSGVDLYKLQSYVGQKFEWRVL